MKYPKKYSAPKVEDLASKTKVAWGGPCELGAGTVGECYYNGNGDGITCRSAGLAAASCGSSGSGG